MAEIQSPNTTPRSGPPPSAETIEAGRRAAEAARRQAEEQTRAAEKVVEKTAEASQEAVRAQGEILHRNIETAHSAFRTGLETGTTALERLSQTMSRAFGISAPDGELAEQSAQNIRAVSQASAALARGSQEASRAWLDLVQRGVRSNLEALAELTSCRSVQDVVALQSKLARENLERVIDSGQQIAQCSAQAMAEATRAIGTAGAGERPAG